MVYRTLTLYSINDFILDQRDICGKKKSVDTVESLACFSEHIISRVVVRNYDDQGAYNDDEENGSR